ALHAQRRRHPDRPHFLPARRRLAGGSRSAGPAAGPVKYRSSASRMTSTTSRPSAAARCFSSSFSSSVTRKLIFTLRFERLKADMALHSVLGEFHRTAIGHFPHVARQRTAERREIRAVYFV